MSFSRRSALQAFSAIGAAGLLARPALAQTRTLTVSTWGGVTEEGLKAYVQPEFERLTGAKLAYDIGGQGARYNKLLAQRANPPADVFFSTDEGVVAGQKAGVLVPASRKGVPNIADIEDWAMSVKRGTTDETIAGAPYTLIAYGMGYNPEKVKEPVTSWADLWRPEFQGKLAFASPVHSQMPAFVILAAEMAGGSIDNVDPGFKKLAELKPSKLTVFWTDWAPLAKSGDVTLGTEFDYYIETMKDQNYPMEYVVPKEKGIAVPEYVSVVKGSKNQELAEAFLNLMLDPKVQASFAASTYSGTTNRKAVLPEAVRARCACGATVDQLRFFDPELFAAKRALWTERMNLEVVPNWQAR
ncbi:ABC transporter substrate-binding protein [Roseomonas marmotae]|uniref:ABC transporter substrate-binding protein n=1 Tax=Roseomonas marmotae TaxID=2768161 RepID=A0ABS3KAW9_9PROT|nr:ABC transporter substrate-binding protein [Roseomonas marmotae]MBO1074592.1 ABC transporter substrate-binding protein [Roseomonas marmotae]QTI81619.1 ABC transporter substrate-binding protein [Roseomonas marmotae]